MIGCDLGRRGCQEWLLARLFFLFRPIYNVGYQVQSREHHSKTSYIFQVDYPTTLLYKYILYSYLYSSRVGPHSKI